MSCLRTIKYKTNILVLIQPYAQTSLTSSQVDRNILFSSLHMLTTAFSDEFVEKGIYCNGILADEHMLKTLEWFLSVNKENFYGKFFSNNKIIYWLNHKIFLPRADEINPTASSAVVFLKSRVGLTSTNSIEVTF